MSKTKLTSFYGIMAIYIGGHLLNYSNLYWGLVFIWTQHTLEWWLGLVVAHWSRSMKLLYAGPS